MLQNNTSSSIPTNNELNPKREGKEHTKAITLRCGVSWTGEVEVEKDKSTCIPSVGDKVHESNEKEYDLKLVEPVKRPTQQASEKLTAFPTRLEERKNKENEEFLKFLNIFKELNVNLPSLELLEENPKYAKLFR
ncbi:reverse transcriptase [Gossypium australe]|uniref:Reverse transcriptase n=1 Tax=Gossypium australe TaxID=47621 RepID=A0A5B6VWL7_9ROSI|nr:reverse transcriptase [Gossypium australe]